MSTYFVIFTLICDTHIEHHGIGIGIKMLLLLMKRTFDAIWRYDGIDDTKLLFLKESPQFL